MDRRFGKIAGGALQYAPDAVIVGGRIVIHPQAGQYARAEDGPWLPVADDPPAIPPRAGHHWEARGWAEDVGRIVRRYAEVADPPPPLRTFRRSWLAQWICAAGKWPAFSAFLAAPEAADLAFLWEYCTEFVEGNPAWPDALAAIKAALALTDAEAAQMLDFGANGGV